MDEIPAGVIVFQAQCDSLTRWFGSTREMMRWRDEGCEGILTECVSFNAYWVTLESLPMFLRNHCQG